MPNFFPQQHYSSAAGLPIRGLAAAQLTCHLCKQETTATLCKQAKNRLKQYLPARPGDNGTGMLTTQQTLGFYRILNS